MYPMHYQPLPLPDLLGSIYQDQRRSESFHGTDRRFELKGTCNGVTVVDDYAHHPTEIRATLESAKNYPHNELWCVFQPHTYSRTIAFLDDFAKALSLM